MRNINKNIVKKENNMKKFIVLIIFLSSFLSAGALVLNNQQTQDINNTLATLLVQEDGSLSSHHTTVQKLIDGNNTIDGGWTNSKYNYIYRILSNTDDKIGIFIITKINNPDSSIVQALDMRDRMIILLDVNQEEKVLFSGYKEELNTPPVTNAGSDKSNYSDTNTYFDASASSDEDGEIVKYKWSENGSIIGEGVTFNKRFTTGTHTITLSVTDDRNATTSDEIVVKVSTRPAPPPPADTTPPVITILGDNPISIYKNSNYIDENATANDNKDGSVIVTTTSNNVDTTQIGDYSVVYSATDSRNNTSTATRTVSVISGKPTLTNTTLNIDENAPNPTVVGKVIVDSNGSSDITNYELNDTTNFTISASGIISTASTFDFETKEVYTFEVNATNGEVSDSVVVTININDVAEVIPVLLDKNTTQITNFTFSGDANWIDEGDNIYSSGDITDNQSSCIIYKLETRGEWH
jgi:hypothetical protein